MKSVQVNIDDETYARVMRHVGSGAAPIGVVVERLLRGIALPMDEYDHCDGMRRGGVEHISFASMVAEAVNGLRIGGLRLIGSSRCRSVVGVVEICGRRADLLGCGHLLPAPAPVGGRCPLCVARVSTPDLAKYLLALGPRRGPMSVRGHEQVIIHWLD